MVSTTARIFVYEGFNLEALETPKGLFFKLASLLPAWGYKYNQSPKVIGENGEKLRLTSKVRLVHKMMHGTYLYLNVKGVLDLLKYTLSYKYTHNRKKKERFLDWFKSKFVDESEPSQQQIVQTDEQKSIPLCEYEDPNSAIQMPEITTTQKENEQLRKQLTECEKQLDETQRQLNAALFKIHVFETTNNNEKHMAERIAVLEASSIEDHRIIRDLTARLLKEAAVNG